MIEKLAILMHHADAAAGQGDVITGQRAHLAVKQGQATCGRHQFGVAQFQEGRFARPRRPGQKVKRPRCQAQGNLGQQFPTTVGIGGIFECDHASAPARFAETCGSIADGREVFGNPRRPYTKLLLGAVPDLAMSGRQRIPVQGEIPNPIDPPPGCAFNPRCPLVFDLCRRQAPELIDGVACHAVNNPAHAALPA